MLRLEDCMVMLCEEHIEQKDKKVFDCFESFDFVTMHKQAMILENLTLDST